MCGKYQDRADLLPFQAYTGFAVPSMEPHSDRAWVDLYLYALYDLSTGTDPARF
jgi:hypothetical protein